LGWPKLSEQKTQNNSDDTSEDANSSSKDVCQSSALANFVWEPMSFCEFLIQKFVVKRSNNGGLQPIIGLLAWKLIFQAFYALLKADCKIKQRKIFFFSFIAHKFVRTFTFVFLRTFLFRRIVWKESAKSLINPSFVKVFTATFMATL